MLRRFSILLSCTVISISSLSSVYAAETQASAPTVTIAGSSTNGTNSSVVVAGAPEQVPGQVAGAPQPLPGWVNFALIGGIILFMWLFVFRPQSKRAKEQRDFLASLTPGIEVITAGGVIGSVVEVKDNIVLLNVGHTQVRVLKTSISGKLDASTSPSPSA